MSKFSRKEWQTKVKKLSKSSLLALVYCHLGSGQTHFHSNWWRKQQSNDDEEWPSTAEAGERAYVRVKCNVSPICEAQLMLSQFIYHSLTPSSPAHLLTQPVFWAFSLIFPFFQLMLNHLGSSTVQGFDLPACRAFADIFQCQHIFLQHWEHGNTLACFH